MIYVFGSINFDYFISAKGLPAADRILTVDKLNTAFGGKGANQAVAAARAGSQVKIFGRVGQDPVGDALVKNLVGFGVDVAGVTRSHKNPSGTAFIFLDGRDHRAVYAQGANAELARTDLPLELLKKCTTLIVQGDVPMQQNEALLVRAKLRGVRTILNLGPPSPVEESVLHSVDFLVVNEHEARACSEMLKLEFQDAKKFASCISERFSCCCVVTLSSKGMVAAMPGGTTLTLAAHPVQALDSVGAGDAFVGHLAAALDQGFDLPVALARANIAAAITCTKIGAQQAIPTKSELELVLAQDAPRSPVLQFLAPNSKAVIQTRFPEHKISP